MQEKQKKNDGQPELVRSKTFKGSPILYPCLSDNFVRTQNYVFCDWKNNFKFKRFKRQHKILYV